ncbi:uncharacterized protein LOC111777232 isoform X5 [Cucurbita pepo subsp. pepo]|uniref:uncharacterized protein LOC111777232 isoform X5 n=1 Tax=Cucurbita pepo subsp. pepo TaxID=3664 RepID=UPI000C9DA251|nr:uncharacterized protein LOC111777232 isoform X5 [Cucurbita pepo subsp. pepo]
MHSIHLLCSQRTRLVYQRQRQQRLQRRGSWCQLTAEEGETAKPGTRIATISPSGEGVAQDAPFEKVELQTAFPKQRENDKKEIPKEASIFQGKTKNRLSQNQLQKHLQDFHVRIDTSC